MNSKPPSESRRNLSGHPTGQIQRPGFHPGRAGSQSRPIRGRNLPLSLPAGGTTAGLPDLAVPGKAGWVADVMLWHLLCQK